METKRDWEKIIRRIELLLRLRSFPVALKMLERKEELGRIPFLRRLGHKATLCQMINLVRNFDWTVGAEAGDFLSPVCASIIGLQEIPDIYKDGTFRSIVWVKTKEDARRYEASIPRLPLGKYEAVAMAPLVYNPFEPDIVLIYANPAQMILLINALQFEHYEVMQFFCVGESSCSDAIARSFLTGKPCLSIPCYGERRYGHAQDDELVMGIPSSLMEKALKALEVLYRRGVRYPISYAGAEQDVSGAFPPAYSGIKELEALRGNDNRLLLGVTGGIASGKTTVANMLAELGAPVVDYDLIARKVVEPGQPALQEIVDYFGTQVLKQDGTLDRKKLSQIVFRDMEKRKKLESFIHPRMGEEVLRQVSALAQKDPNAIIQMVVPLMIELNLQYQCHKLLVVYIPQEMQIQRLMKRDGISRDQAMAMLKSQMPMEEKLEYADFVIRNEGSLEETRKQVKELWEKLTAIQERKKNLGARSRCEILWKPPRARIGSWGEGEVSLGNLADIRDYILRKCSGLKKAAGEILYGMTVYELDLELRRERRALEDLLLIALFGDMLGLPFFPPYFSLRLLPHAVPSLELWKRSLLREKDLTELVGRE